MTTRFLSVVIDDGVFSAQPGRADVFGMAAPPGLGFRAEDVLRMVHRMSRDARTTGAVVVVREGEPAVKSWREATWRPDPGALAATELLADGSWSCQPGVDTWTTWRHADGTTVYVVFAGAMSERNHLFGAADDSRIIARRLAWYQARMGGPWIYTAGVSAHAAIRANWSDPRDHRAHHQPYWGARDDGSVKVSTPGDLMWKRPPLRAELARGWVHAFDLNAARLSALGVADLAYRRLTHVGPQAFDPALAGYWLVPAADIPPAKHRPHVFDPSDVVDGAVRLTTPLMKYLMDQGRQPAAIDSWTSPSRRLLRGIANQWNEARLIALDRPGPALNAVKATYREGAGLMARPGGSIYRPDWYHTTCDRQRVTVLTHCDRIEAATGARPLAIHTDCLWFACDQADPREAAAWLGIKLGHALGTFRLHSSTPMGEFYKRKDGAK